MSPFICPKMCCRCVLGNWFSCWMGQYDRPPVIHLRLSFLLFSHTHTNGCSWRKSCLIHEMYNSESHRVLLRIQDCTHRILPVESFFVFVFCSHTHIHTDMLQGIYLSYLLFWLDRNAVVWVWPRSSSAATGELPADACWMWCFAVFFGSSSVEGVI